MHFTHRLLKFISLRMKLGVKMEHYIAISVQMNFDLFRCTIKQDYNFSSPVFFSKFYYNLISSNISSATPNFAQIKIYYRTDSKFYLVSSLSCILFRGNVYSVNIDMGSLDNGQIGGQLFSMPFPIVLTK